jgi:hypothetical protein
MYSFRFEIYFKTLSKIQSNLCIMDNTRRTIAEQEVLALMAPLGKLGRFEEAADFFQPNA